MGKKRVSFLMEHCRCRLERHRAETEHALLISYFEIDGCRNLHNSMLYSFRWLHVPLVGTLLLRHHESTWLEDTDVSFDENCRENPNIPSLGPDFGRKRGAAQPSGVAISFLVPPHGSKVFPWARLVAFPEAAKARNIDTSRYNF
jgi:hypothetical protein